MITSMATSDLLSCREIGGGWFVALGLFFLFATSMALNWYYIWKLNKIKGTKK